jgi:uncharacterized protein YxeA
MKNAPWEFTITLLLLLNCILAGYYFATRNSIEIDNGSCYVNASDDRAFAKVVQVEDNSVLYQYYYVTYGEGLEKQELKLNSKSSFVKSYELVDCIGGLGEL